jgi:hypothetical protein
MSKPKKRKIGTLNVKTGVFTPLSKARRKPPKRIEPAPYGLPESLTLPADEYDKLRKLVEWVEAKPDEVNLGERAWDAIDDLLIAPFEFLNSDEFIISVQVETAKTSERGIKSGTLVALMENEASIDADTTEVHIAIIRGK